LGTARPSKIIKTIIISTGLCLFQPGLLQVIFTNAPGSNICWVNMQGQVLQIQLSIDHDQIQFMYTMSLRGRILPYKGYIVCTAPKGIVVLLFSGHKAVGFFFSSSPIFFQRTDQNFQSSNALRNDPRSHFIKPPAQERLGDAAQGGYKIEWFLA